MLELMGIFLVLALLAIKFAKVTLTVLIVAILGSIGAAVLLLSTGIPAHL